jgi:hypothetical protein
MLNRIIITFLIVLGLGTAAEAQNAKPDPQIRKLKIEFVTGKMALSAQQLQNFLPLYNQYSDELLYYRKAIKALDNNANTAESLSKRQQYEEKMVAIKGNYKDRFLKVITAQQLAAMYKAEGDFKSVLLNHLKKKG